MLGRDRMPGKTETAENADGRNNAAFPDRGWLPNGSEIWVDQRARSLSNPPGPPLRDGSGTTGDIGGSRESAWTIGYA